MNIEIANRLAELRKAHGYSQEELADKLGVSRQAISKWECGESSPDTDNLIALAKVYNMSLDELLDNPVREEKKEKKAPETEVVDAEVVDSASSRSRDFDDDDDDYDDDENIVGLFREKSTLWKIIGIINGCGFTLALVAYILLGIFWKGPTGYLGWASGWILFLVPVILGSLLHCIDSHRATRFAYPVFIVAVYCGMGIIGGAYGVNLWHPFWVLFITIPVYYSIAGSIEHVARKK